MAEVSEQVMIAEVVYRLISSYPQHEHDHVVSVVRQTYAGFEQSPVRDFVPLLVERKARAQLAKEVDADGTAS